MGEKSARGELQVTGEYFKTRRGEDPARHKRLHHVLTRR